MRKQVSGSKFQVTVTSMMCQKYILVFEFFYHTQFFWIKEYLWHLKSSLVKILSKLNTKDLSLIVLMGMVIIVTKLDQYFF